MFFAGRFPTHHFAIMKIQRTLVTLLIVLDDRISAMGLLPASHAPHFPTPGPAPSPYFSTDITVLNRITPGPYPNADMSIYGLPESKMETALETQQSSSGLNRPRSAKKQKKAIQAANRERVSKELELSKTGGIRMPEPKNNARQEPSELLSDPVVATPSSPVSPWLRLDALRIVKDRLRTMFKAREDLEPTASPTGSPVLKEEPQEIAFSSSDLLDSMVGKDRISRKLKVLYTSSSNSGLTTGQEVLIALAGLVGLAFLVGVVARFRKQIFACFESCCKRAW